MIKTFWNWLSRSSVDPAAISVTLKAGVPALVLIFGVMGYHLPDQYFSGVIDQAVNFVVALSAVVTSFIALFGLIRKLIITFPPKS